MSQPHPAFQELFDAKGQPLGVFLGPEAWALVRQDVLAHFGPKPADLQEELPVEPTSDWNDLVQFWDFKYPVDRDVHCTICGNETADWQQDDPRKFLLTAANMGGLVSFRCLGCQCKIIKRHFKDCIKVEARPFVPEKSVRNLGRAK